MRKLQTASAKISVLLAVIIITTFSCQKNSTGPQAAGTTSFTLHLTDDPSFVFDAVLIDIAKVEVKLEDDSTLTENETEAEHNGGNGGGGTGSNNGAGGGNWVALNIRPGVYNVLNFRNGVDTLLGAAGFSSKQTPSKVRITLGFNNSVILDGKTIALKLNNNIVVINLADEKVDVSSSSLDVFLDFDAGNSIKLNNGVFELNSSIKAFSKQKAGGIEGRVTPAAAHAIVYAVNGTDTSTAMPEKEGEFKIMGLKPGTYSLFVKATANNYQNAVINGIVVGLKEDTQAGTITLHQ